ncbi:MAG TPA: hypothetical protein VF624_05980 [Tepidisphaeraceae bacterium]
MPPTLGPISLDRMVAAVENVRKRLLRSTAALGGAGIPYAVAGGNAVAAWVSRVDTAAVRYTQDVDILINRADLDRAKAALAAAGFVYRHVSGLDVFLDGPEAKARDAVHIVFAGEKVREHEPAPNPSVDDAEDDAHFRVLTLQALVTIKLTAFRDKDRTHIRDLIGVDLIDATWLTRLPEPLAARLKTILDDPNG